MLTHHISPDHTHIMPGGDWEWHAGDWYELLIPWRIMRCSKQTCHTSRKSSLTEYAEYARNGQ